MFLYTLEKMPGIDSPVLFAYCTRCSLHVPNLAQFLNPTIARVYSSPQLTIVSLVTILSYSGIETNDRFSCLQPLQNPYGHMIKIQALGNWNVFYESRPVWESCVHHL